MKKQIAICVILAFMLSAFAGILYSTASATPHNPEITFGTEVPLVTGSLSGTGDTEMYYIDVNANALSMRTILDFTASYYRDFDVYGRLGAQPTTSTYNWRGYTYGTEDVTYNNPGAGRWYIMVRSYRGSGSFELTITVEYNGGGDTQAPSVDITSPTAGSTVSGSITVQASASDNVGVTSVQCRVDSGSWAEDTSSPYSWTWDTTGSSDGSHTLYVQAYDAAGNIGTDQVTITVDNGGGGGGGGQIQDGVTSTGSLSATGETQMWYIDVPSDCTSMRTVLDCPGVDFDVYGRLNAEPTTSTYTWRGYTSGGEDVTYSNPGAGRWYIMVRSYSGSGSYSLTVTLTTGGGGGGEGEKICAFFWASDAGAQWVIDKYVTILQGEGYTKFFNFKDTTNFESAFNSVDDYETSDDTVFFYLFGHGNNNGAHSYTAFRPSSMIVYSNEFRTMCDRLESPRVGFLIESCHSGDWADDFYGADYLAMSTSDETHYSYAVGTLPNEGKFSLYFWQRVDAGYGAVAAFNYAKNYVTNPVQNPKICNQCSYDFFA